MWGPWESEDRLDDSMRCTHARSMRGSGSGAQRKASQIEPCDQLARARTRWRRGRPPELRWEAQGLLTGGSRRLRAARRERQDGPECPTDLVSGAQASQEVEGYRLYKGWV